MYKLRDYQQKSHNCTLEYISGNRKKSGIVVVPTGGGKSLLQAKLVHDYNDKALIISPTIEILEQNYKKFIEYGGEASIYSASLSSKEIGDITYASLKSIDKLGSEFNERGVKLLIIDEAHLNSDAGGGMLKRFVGKMNPKFIVGYTATPFRVTTRPSATGYSESLLTMLPSTFPKIFDDYIHVTQISDLIKNGFWAPIELENHSFNTSGLAVTSSGLDYQEDALTKRNKELGTNNKIYRRIKELLPVRRSILVFMDSVDNCMVMKNALGDCCEVIHGKLKTKDRKRILDEFKEGKIKVICCHSALVVGFDFPQLDTVIMGRPTKSLAVFYQIYGRLVRPFEGKQGLFIDYGNNLSLFGDMHNLVIEDYRGIGHEVFYKDRMITGTPLLGPDVTKLRLDDMVERKMRLEASIEPDLDHLMTFGKYKGTLITEVPRFYLEWLISSNLPLDTTLRITINHILKKPTSLY